ncbi:acyltransferase [Bradyrhizobium sp. 192]|uniref:acyltransferase family protein n=1 Tax=Bradyrhizobium sp. 192 TaxID=2782660 RepID=UPI001FFEEF3C|nr:acyltransferase [Bradyrhizobium sp. 192]
MLDPLRFAAALGVAIFHQMFWSWAWTSIGVPGFERTVAADVIYPSAAPFTWFGWVGVEIFFVISGFVIANSASQSSPGAFLLGRALRLYPAVWVCATATLLVLLLFGSGPASELILPYIHAMLMVPKGVTGQWLDEVYWTLAAETAFYGLVFCAMLTRKITLRHLAFGLTIYSAMFNAVALLVASCTTPSDLPYLVILMFRVPCAAFLLSHGCFFALGDLAVHLRQQAIDGARTGRRRRHLSFGRRGNLFLRRFLFDVDTRHRGSVSPRSDHGLGGRGVRHCPCRETKQALGGHRFS